MEKFNIWRQYFTRYMICHEENVLPFGTTFGGIVFYNLTFLLQYQ